MKGKKVVIILLFLCFFISLTSVSASADVNITNDDYNNNLESVNENTGRHGREADRSSGQ